MKTQPKQITVNNTKLITGIIFGLIVLGFILHFAGIHIVTN